jgi:hypothetical protein
MAKVKLPRNMPFPFKEETIRFWKLRVWPVVPASARLDRPVFRPWYKNHVYDRSFRPVTRYDWPYTDNINFKDFSGMVYGVKKICDIFVEKRGMDLSHESIKNFDPLLIVRDPYTKQQRNEKGRTTVSHSSELRLQVFFSFFSLCCTVTHHHKRGENLTCT